MKQIYLYHGSITPEISELIPRKRCTPLGLEDVEEKVYAGLTPAYATAHAFLWGTEEGFKLTCHNNIVTLKVPARFQNRLAQPVYIYTLPLNGFVLLDIAPKGYNFASSEKVIPISMKEFHTVGEAMEHYGGTLEIIL